MLQIQPDLFLENKDSVAAVYFAGFAEGMKKWKNHTQSLAPLTGWTQMLLRQVFPDKRVGIWLVFAMEGQVIEM